MSDFKLSATLAGHEDDVRGVAFPSPKALISASRDGTVRIWHLASDSPPKYDDTISSQSQSFVNAVAYVPPSKEYSEGLIVSGGKETIIDVRQPSRKPEDSAEALLLGHSLNVCALNVDEEGKFIVSGSWDNEVKIWQIGKWEADVTLRGHEYAPWAVLAYDPNTIITASADTNIRIYNRSGKLLKQFRASDGPVRALAKLPKNHASGADFASAANDGIIRLWNLSGQNLGELHGHESFVYSIASLPTGELVSSGEDRTVRVWKGAQCIQTITHPAISVWQVAVCQETGDIVTGASDKIVRVFSRDSSRHADAETTRQFEDSVKESSIPQQQMDQKIEKEKLPGPSFLQQKSGTKDGQVQMIREDNGAVTAHMWSNSQQRWDNVGTVVDAVGSSGKKVDYQGKSYDYVFDVDIEDGKPALKLPYNLSQNPYEAATKFITTNELPISYLDQVANFIITNTQGATVGASQQTSGPDAWGTENRYRPGDAPAPTTSLPPAPKMLPQKDYLNILVARPPAIEKKILELNAELIKSGSKHVALNPEETKILAGVRQFLEAVVVKKSSSPIDGGLELVIKLVTQWPYKDRMPGLDLLRLLVVSPDAASFSHRDQNIIDVFLAGATETDSPAENHVMMAVRGFGNLFETAEGRRVALANFDKISSTVKTFVASTNRNLLVAISTLFINYAVLFTSELSTDTSFEHVLSCLDVLTKIIEKQKDSEVVYRALVALGTLLTLDDEAKGAARDVYDVKALVGRVSGATVDKRIKEIGKEVVGLL